MNTNTIAVWVEMEAKPGKEADLESLLRSFAPIAQNEPDTTAWFAVRLSDSRFAIFDTFSDEGAREVHLNGGVAEALDAKADELLANPVNIQQVTILAEKTLPSQ